MVVYGGSRIPTAATSTCDISRRRGGVSFAHQRHDIACAFSCLCTTAEVTSSACCNFTHVNCSKMASFESEQRKLQGLWDELLSNESDFSADGSVYQTESDVESSDESDCVRRRKALPLKKTTKKSASSKGKSVIRKVSSGSSDSDEERLKKGKTNHNAMLDNLVIKVVSNNDVNNIPSTSGTQKKCVTPSMANDQNPSTQVEIDGTHIDEVIEQVIANNMVDIPIESDQESIDLNPDNQFDLIWGSVTGNNIKIIDFSEANHGIRADLYVNYEKSPYDFYKMIINDEIIDLFVTETNKYAAQEKNKVNFTHGRLNKWKDTDKNEMEKFIGILMWMGLFTLPNLQAYWSNNFLYSNNLNKVLSRNRFQVLLKTWHFADNEVLHDINDRMYKITPLLNKLRTSFQSHIVPGEFICIDETLVPFKGKLKFKQYINNKRHKFGIKLFKLCLENGYLYEFKVYCGQEKTPGNESTVPTKVVLELTHDLLGKGRTLCVDNYYTSVELAHKLLDENTHTLGTLRNNRKKNPRNVIDKKLKKGEVISEESSTGIFVEKWKDKRDVIMLNTKFMPEMVTIHKRSGDVQKPKSVIEYNKHKSYIDLSGSIT